MCFSTVSHFGLAQTTNAGSRLVAEAKIQGMMDMNYAMSWQTVFVSMPESL